MNNRRKLLVALGAGTFTAPLASFAQQPARVFRIGFLSSESASGYRTRVEALRAGLRGLGYEEGKNIIVEFRWAEAKHDRLPDLAADLVRLKVDVLVTHATPGSLAAKRATSTIPIVAAVVADPVDLGLVASLARPTGNITGSTYFSSEIAAKRLELLKDVMPRITQAAAFVNPDNPATGTIVNAMQRAAKSLNVVLQQFEARRPSEFGGAFLAMAKRSVGAFVIVEDPMFLANAKGIADLAAKQRLPSIGFNELVEAGGLIGYAPNFLEMWRRAAYFVDRILKGAKPSDLPIEQPTKFEMLINGKTAKALGIKIPNSILVRADKVIE